MKTLVSVLLGTCLVSCVLSQCTFIDKTATAAESQAEAKLHSIAAKLKRIEFKDANVTYLYSLGVCVSALPDQAQFKTGVTQKELTTTAGKVRNLGRIDNATVTAGTNWVFLEYFNGEPYNRHCTGETRSSRIMFNCVPEATEAEGRVIEEMTDKVKGCYYLFEVDTAAACPPATPVSHKLSVGSVLCIIFMVFVAVYLIGGAIYQRLVAGAKGMEQIPNYSFWQDFGNLQADGCDFLCRSGGKTRGSREYRGIGDDQIAPSHEDLSHDDTLLTM